MARNSGWGGHWAGVFQRTNLPVPTHVNDFLISDLAVVRDRPRQTDRQTDGKCDDARGSPVPAAPSNYQLVVTSAGRATVAAITLLIVSSHSWSRQVEVITRLRSTFLCPTSFTRMIMRLYSVDFLYFYVSLDIKFDKWLFYKLAGSIRMILYHLAFEVPDSVPSYLKFDGVNCYRPFHLP